MDPSYDYKSAVSRLKKSGSLYEDPDFPVQNSIPSMDIAKDIQWLRPKEVSPDPVFISKGTARYDIQQGIVQDCFLLAGIACIAVTNKQLFDKVIPPNQNFKEDYTGLFHFNFWSNGTWIEVWVDDRLPYLRGRPIFAFKRTRATPHELWVSLMEKAYAKLKGGYENLKGGYVNEALVDLTGGISERVNLSVDREKLGPSLFDTLRKTTQMASLLGCSIESDKLEEEDMGNGLYGGHAYSITSLAEIPYKGQHVKLVRLRNPWGEVEWDGAWCDRSKEWANVSQQIKDRIGFYEARDGEFWMLFDDWLREFDEVSMCHLNPGAFLRERYNEFDDRKSWEVITFHGQWARGQTAGGCGNKQFDQDLYWTNPQFTVTIRSGSDGRKDNTTIIVSLSQKTSHAGENNYISFKLFKVKNDNQEPGRKYNKTDLQLAKWPKDFMNVREVTGHFMLEPSKYAIIPSTFEPGKEGLFMLRVFTEEARRAEGI